MSSTVEQTITYEIGGEAAGSKVGGSTSLSFTGAYGQNSGTSESMEVGSTAGVEAQVTYRRQLTGGVFVHYGKRQGGLYFWNVPLAKLYHRHTLSQTQRETLRVDFYARTTQRDLRPEELAQLPPARAPVPG